MIFERSSVFSLLQKLGIHLHDSARTEIFASTDFPSDGTVSEKEFSDAWQNIELQILRRLGMTLGLSKTEERVKMQIAQTHLTHMLTHMHATTHIDTLIYVHIQTYTHTHTH
jgi:hypothetical protein